MFYVVTYLMPYFVTCGWTLFFCPEGAAWCRYRPERGVEMSWRRRWEDGGQHFRTGEDKQLLMLFVLYVNIKVRICWPVVHLLFHLFCGFKNTQLLRCYHFSWMCLIRRYIDSCCRAPWWHVWCMTIFRNAFVWLWCKITAYGPTAECSFLKQVD